jgi:hypothetical protein
VAHRAGRKKHVIAGGSELGIGVPGSFLASIGLSSLV